MILTGLRDELRRRGIRQADVALKMGMAESELSRFLNGRRVAPEGFESSFLAAVDEVAEEQVARLLGEPAGAAK